MGDNGRHITNTFQLRTSTEFLRALMMSDQWHSLSADAVLVYLTLLAQDDEIACPVVGRLSTVKAYIPALDELRDVGLVEGGNLVRLVDDEILFAPDRSRRERRLYKRAARDHYRMVRAEEQGWACDLCGVPFGTRDPQTLARRAHLDHDHESGLERGLLCPGCNNAVGRVENSISSRFNGASYTEDEAVSIRHYIGRYRA